MGKFRNHTTKTNIMKKQNQFVQVMKCCLNNRKFALLIILILISIENSLSQISDEQAKKIVFEMIKTFEANKVPEIKKFKQFEKCISSTSEYLNTQNEFAKASNRYKNGYPNILRYKDSLDYTLKKLNYYIYLNNKQKKGDLEFKNLQIIEFKKITKEDYFAGTVKQYFHDVYLQLYDSITSNNFTFKIRILESNNTIIILSNAEDLDKEFVTNSSIKELIESTI